MEFVIDIGRYSPTGMEALVSISIEMLKIG